MNSLKDPLKVTQDFCATTRDELTVRSGEMVTVLNRSDVKEWVLVQKLNSPRRGWVPLQNLESA